ncbi:unnamed protein product [Adineta ricciae]|uniref:Uncharacterized protein n=1 Tax=Adineta ricciae TaxID=249248 RepID=A0A814KNZ2_ADIRI|nr:unnamed protein product [Adineta ricciae]
MILFDSSIIFMDELKSIAALKNELFQPERVVNDFEIGLILAVAAELFIKCLNRRIQSLGLSTTYAEDDEIRPCCRKLMALCLLPLQEVENQFYNLRASLDSRLKQELRQLFLYFQNHWMIDVPLQMWNFHDTPHRTNNICEAFHGRLNRQCRFQHLYSQINAGTQQLPKAKAADTMQK